MPSDSSTERYLTANELRLTMLVLQLICDPVLTALSVTQLKDIIFVMFKLL